MENNYNFTNALLESITNPLHQTTLHKSLSGLFTSAEEDEVRDSVNKGMLAGTHNHISYVFMSDPQ